jgi:hypothetical protein
MMAASWRVWGMGSGYHLPFKVIHLYEGIIHQ